MNKQVKRMGLLPLCVGLLLPSMTGCMTPNAGEDTTERTLRIATSMGAGPGEEYFRQRFTELYEFAHKNIKIEIVSTQDERYMYGGQPDPNEKPKDPMETLKELMQGANPPDVVMMGYEQLPELVENGLVTELDSLIAQNKFNTADMVPAVIEGIKKAGNGKLYALSPTFSSTALIYNKQMFDEAGVEYPKDKMTWDETFELARRLAKGEGESRKYGFSFSTYNSGGDLFYPMQTYSAPLQLEVFDEKGEKMTVNTDQWAGVWKKMIDLNKEKLFPVPIDYSKMQGGPSENYNPFQHDDFLSGRVAMAMIHYNQLEQVTNAMKHAQGVKGFTPFDWDVVTMPIHPEAGDVGGSIWMEGLMGINTKAQNAKDAWDFIQFINGEDWARLKGSSQNNLVTRKSYIKPRDGATFNINAFTTLMPIQSDNNRSYFQKPNIYHVMDIGRMKFQQAVEGKLEVSEALKQWETEGDAMLQKIKENPDAPIEPIQKMGQGG